MGVKVTAKDGKVKFDRSESKPVVSEPKPQPQPSRAERG